MWKSEESLEELVLSTAWVLWDSISKMYIPSLWNIPKYFYQTEKRKSFLIIFVEYIPHFLTYKIRRAH